MKYNLIPISNLKIIMAITSVLSESVGGRTRLFPRGSGL